MGDTLFPDLVVNGEHIPHTAVAAEVQNHTAPKGKPGLAWRKAAKALAMRALLLQEARRRGLTPVPEVLSPGRIETGDEALIRQLLDEAVQVPAPSDTAVRDEWARDPERFRAPPLWEVSHILIACDPRDEAARAAAKARAEALTDRLRRDPGAFARLAAEHSDCGSRTAGGSLGQIGPGDTVPEFEAALRTLAQGDILAEPVLSRHGWHVIRLDAVAIGEVLPFDAVRPAIAAALEKAAWVRAARDFAEGLTAAARITGIDLSRS
ncbi:MAG: peptidyl-prolyl cis-trans isomerase [Rhodobacter sp.]|nr:peptidyl-prolyl cis-trans isomerase [Paracoccaceae bacterium]MCC0076630.1 peptidyl-prolyl cis-trans isomerase [Rhodobacter sp.]